MSSGNKLQQNSSQLVVLPFLGKKSWTFFSPPCLQFNASGNDLWKNSGGLLNNKVPIVACATSCGKWLFIHLERCVRSVLCRLTSE